MENSKNVESQTETHFLLKMASGSQTRDPLRSRNKLASKGRIGASALESEGNGPITNPREKPKNLGSIGNQARKTEVDRDRGLVIAEHN